jgi:hypothetical protein
VSGHGKSLAYLLHQVQNAVSQLLFGIKLGMMPDAQEQYVKTI